MRPLTPPVSVISSVTDLSPSPYEPSALETMMTPIPVFSALLPVRFKPANVSGTNGFN